MPLCDKSSEVRPVRFRTGDRRRIRLPSSERRRRAARFASSEMSSISLPSRTSHLKFTANDKPVRSAMLRWDARSPVSVSISAAVMASAASFSRPSAIASRSMASGMSTGPVRMAPPSFAATLNGAVSTSTDTEAAIRKPPGAAPSTPLSISPAPASPLRFATPGASLKAMGSKTASNSRTSTGAPNGSSFATPYAGAVRGREARFL